MPESTPEDHALKVKKVTLDLGARHGDDNQLKLWARMMVNKQQDNLSLLLMG